MPVSLAARAPDRLDRVQRRPGSLDARQLALDQLRGRALARALMRSISSRFRPLLVGDEALEVGVVRVRLGDQVEQVEGPAAGGPRQVRVVAETMLPAAPVITKTESPAQRALRVGLASRLDEAHPPAQAVRVADLDRAGIAQGLLHSRSASAAVLRLGGKSTALISASGRSRASALVKPVTAPPSTEVAPAAS